MKNGRWGVLMVAVLALVSVSASADTVKAELDDWFGDNAPPEGDAPWLTACFEDMGDFVRLTMSTAGLVDDEFVSNWFFNFNPAKDVEDLDFTFVSGVAATIQVDEDDLKADGDGYFDIQFAFPTSEGSRFGAGQTTVYDIALVGDGLTAADFAFMEYDHQDGKGSGPHYSSAHIQSIGTSATSAWIGATGTGTCDPVPEPASMVLLGLGLTGMALRRLRRR